MLLGFSVFVLFCAICMQICAFVCKSYANDYICPSIKDKSMKDNFSISIYLDTRRKLQSGKFPVKLRVFTPAPRKQKLFATGYEMTQTEFSSIWETTKPRTEHKAQRFELQSIENEALKIAKEISHFSIEAFEVEMFGAKFNKSNVFEHYKRTIDTLKDRGQISTALTYELSQKSIIKFLASCKRKNIENLSFVELTPLFLNTYENFMLDNNKSSATIGIYLRPLRAIIKQAIEQKIIDSDSYPFGKNKYQIPATKAVKKALSDSELKLLFEGEPQNEFQAKAKAFWFFSFSCNGMNIKDILNLRFKDLQDDSLSFYRAKTINTNKANLKPVIVPLTNFAKQVIEQYANTDQTPTDFIFPIIDRNQSKEKQHLQNQNFTRFINQHFKKYAASLGITSEVSTYWARHSFATRAIRSGASLEFVSEALSHSNLQTTKGYFAGFESEQKREFAETLMNF
jgi:integrase/recombinase XerD